MGAWAWRVGSSNSWNSPYVTGDCRLEERLAQAENDRERRKNGFTAASSRAADRGKRVTPLFTGLFHLRSPRLRISPHWERRIVRLTSPRPIGYSNMSVYLRTIRENRVAAISLLASSFAKGVAVFGRDTRPRGGWLDGCYDLCEWLETQYITFERLSKKIYTRGYCVCVEHFEIFSFVGNIELQKFTEVRRSLQYLAIMKQSLVEPCL